MEIRTLKSNERESLLDLLDGWEMLDSWQGREFFARCFGEDPSYSDDNVWVAVEGDRLLSCAQIFPRRIRILGHAISAGGIGTVYTDPSRRNEGLASATLEAAVIAMTQREMVVSILFAGKLDFYGKRGWSSWKSERSILRKAEVQPTGVKLDASDDVEIAVLDRDRDFAAVKAIHSAYSASRNGTVVRDDSLWDASLKLAGNPSEEFLVARSNGTAVAYARCTFLNGIFTVTELARREDAAVPLALLMTRMMEARDDDPLAPDGVSSSELRSAMLLPAFDDLALTVALEHRGLATHPVEDPTSMLRCLNMNELAEQLDITLFPDEVPADFLARILPRDSLVFWSADRF
jgi:GNAT superfamily N-acetyltransferase